MLQEPTSHRIDPDTGALSAATGRYDKRLTDLDGLYADAAAFGAACAKEGARVVYRVQDVRPRLALRRHDLRHDLHGAGPHRRWSSS